MHLTVVSEGYMGHNGIGYNGYMRRVAAVRQRRSGPCHASAAERNTLLESMHSPAQRFGGADCKIELPEECQPGQGYLSHDEYAHVQECLAQHFGNTEEDRNTIVNFTWADLDKYGITDVAVQAFLLQALADYRDRVNPRNVPKTIWIERPNSEGMPSGDYDIITFSDARGFEVYTKQHMLFRNMEDGSQEFIADYDDIEDEGRYCGFMCFRFTRDDRELFRVTRQAKETALAFIKEKHDDDAELLKPGAYANSTGEKQQLDVVVVAEGCVLVTQAKAVIDLDAVEQLENKVRFVREAAADRAPALEFAWNKDIKGALAGMALPESKEQEAAVREAVGQHHWELFLLNGHSN